jgi:hypothetical protein
MFEPILARERRRASCAAAELTKDLWREKTDLSEKIDRFINWCTAKIFEYTEVKPQNT